MKSLGDIIKQANLDTKPAPQTLPSQAEPRLHKVHLCAHVYAEIEVMASTPEKAFSIAQERVKEARRTWRTAFHPFRVAIQKRIDPAESAKGRKWVRLDHVLDDRTDCWVWKTGADDITPG